MKYPGPFDTQNARKKDTPSIDKYRQISEKVYNKYSYDENYQFCRNNVVASPHGVGGCKIEDGVQERSDGDFADPSCSSLMSLWEVTFDIPRKYKEFLPFPVRRIDLKVEGKKCFRQFRGKICFRQSRGRRQGQRLRQGAAESGNCCGGAGKFADRNGNCRSCPEGSAPRLNGYFCESCPEGSAPRLNAYFCESCPVGFEPGNGESGRYGGAG